MNFGIEEEKTTFVFIFSTYLPGTLLKFRAGERVGCGIQFCIRRVPTLHTFDGTRYLKNKKYPKKCDDDVELNSASNKLCHLKCE